MLLVCRSVCEREEEHSHVMRGEKFVEVHFLYKPLQRPSPGSDGKNVSDELREARSSLGCSRRNKISKNKVFNEFLVCSKTRASAASF